MRTLLLLMVLSGAVEAAAEGDLASDPSTRTLAWELLKVARYGQATKEHAAFIVRDESGGLRLLRWPSGETWKRAAYRGAIPPGTVAIVHTHPNDLPNPSDGDTALARRLALPVYVLTRNSIARTDGSRTDHLARGDWNPNR